MHDYSLDTHQIANDRSVPNTFWMCSADNKTGNGDKNNTECISYYLNNAKVRVFRIFE